MMVTKLNVVEAKITGGREIDCLSYNTKNQTLHLCALPLSKLLLFLMECDSNNTTSIIVPNDAVIIHQQLGAFKEELDFSKELLDQPSGRLEKTFKILIPTQVEMKKFTNPKIQRVALAVHNLLSVMMSVDSGGTKNFVGMADGKSIEASFKVVKKVADKWIGSGKKLKDGVWETGVEIPPMIEVGRIEPDTDADAATLNEPSADVGDLHLPDAPDTKSTKTPE